MRTILSGAKAVILALTLTVAGVAPAAAVGPAPRSMPQFNGSVYAIALRGTAVYVGGSFTAAIVGGRTYPRQRLAAFDARTGALLNWRPSANGTVRALVTSGAAIYAAGDFTVVSGARRDSLAGLDATSGALGSFAHRVSGTTYALAAGAGRLYLGGRFSAVDGVARDNLAAFALSGGGLDRGWRPRTDDAVHALAAYGPRVYLGGAFETVDDVPGTERLAAVSATGGTVDRGFLPRTAAEVNAVIADTTGVYAATGGQGGRAVAYTAGGVLRWQRVFDGDAVAIARLGGVTYVGGHFDHACLTPANGLHGTCTGGSVPRVKLAAVTAPGGLSSWAPQANGVIGVRALAADPARKAIAAGGDFTVVGGRDRLRYASFS